MVKGGKSFCAKCGDDLREGKGCRCTPISKDVDRTVLVKAVFCEDCERELYVDEVCHCKSMVNPIQVEPKKKELFKKAGEL